MNCSGCGFDNPDTARFCGDCGAELSTALRCASCGTENSRGQKFCNGCGQRLTDSGAEAPSLRMTPVSPTAFASGRYTVERLLGEGAKKRVYLARDTRLARDVAIGVIKREGLDAEGRLRARREAQAMGQLGDHAHIVTVHDVEEEGEDLFIVSQYMAGGDLEARLTGATSHQLPIDEALRIATEICQALEHAHSRGIIHRDLKPGNVWFTEEGTARLGDFGLALSLERSRLTQEGMMVGTAAYMAPEQALGGTPDAQSDFYALGAMLYEMTAGRPPFLGDDAVAVISQHINTAPVAPSWHNPEIPRALEALILQLLAKDPSQRPGSAETVRRELATVGSMSADGVASEERAAANPLDRLAAGVFVGRDRELGQLRAAFDDALSGCGRILMLVGEPGIGKTRTAEELATYARLRGAQVLWGRCYEGEGAPAYWPWVQIIRAYVHDREPGTLMSEMGTGAADIAEVVSEVRERLPGLPRPVELEPEQARFRLFDSVTSFLKNASKGQPLAIVVDDLHWADQPSLLLLQFLARELGSSRLLLLGTYRDVELGRQHPLEQTLAELVRSELSERVLLRGLGEADVARFIEFSAGRTPPQPLVEAVCRETEGNPFFVHEVVQLLQSDGRLDHPEDVSSWSLEIPQGVRQVVGRRLSSLTEECNRVLGIASVIGREFELPVLAAVSELEEDAALELLEDAEGARIVGALPDTSGSYRFSHALIRETLYEEIRTTRRLRLHRRIAEVLEDLHAAKLEPRLAELAYHFCEAAHGGDVDKAVDYAVRAAERAIELVAYEEAAASYERALQALELGDSADPMRRFELLIACAETHKVSGAVQQAEVAARRAAEIARREHRFDLLARAALAFSLDVPRTGETEGQRLIEEALERLGDGEPALRARLLTHLASNLVALPATRSRAEPLLEEAIALARENDDPLILGRALRVAAWDGWSDGQPQQLLAWADELGALAERTGRRELWLWSRITRAHGLLELSRIPEAWGELDAFRAVAEEHRQPLFLWWADMHRALRSTMEGRFDAALSYAHSARALGRRASEPNREITFWVQMLAIQRLQGGAEAEREVASAPPEEMKKVSATATVRAWQTWLLAALGEVEAARAELDSLEEEGFAAALGASGSLPALGWLAGSCVLLRDLARAALLYDLLLPHAGRLMCQFSYVCYGSTSRPLGALAHLLGRFEEAEHHFEQALQTFERVSARPFAAEVRIDYARMLRDRGGPGDAARSLDLVNDALTAAQEIGMAAAVREALALKLELQGMGSGEAQGSIHMVSSAVQERRPDLTPHVSPDGTVTLMFSDMEGFTAMTERLGDLGALEVIRSHNTIVREQLAAHDGCEVELQGDGFLLAFSSARRGLLCAIAIQRAFAAYSEAHPEEPIRVRIGLHTGEALRDADKFFGKTVILAARIASQASGGEILASALLKELTESAGDIRFGQAREVELKGLSERQRVHSVEWE